MASGPSYLDKKILAAARSGVSQAAATPSSPHTPQRNPPSTFSSPGTGFRSEEENAIFDIGARHVYAGYVGDSRPRCRLQFDREESRRVGDFRRWLPGYEHGPPLATTAAEWSSEYELWQEDIRHANLSLVEDKLERAVREAYTQFLLQDPKSRKLVLAVPSVLPRPLLSIIFSTMFHNFQIPSITLLPCALLALFAAGQRSGVVIDIGWHETVITAIYELREVGSVRTVRATKYVVLAMAEMMDQAGKSGKIELSHKVDSEEVFKYDFESAEDATTRLAWCWPTTKKASESQGVSDIDRRLQSFSIASDQSSNIGLQAGDMESTVTLPARPGSNTTTKVRFADLALPVDHAIFASTSSHQAQDDHEQTVHFLGYKMLAELSADIRAACMPNIVVTGGGSNIPGLKSRIMDELAQLIAARGWDLVSGRASDQRRKKLQEIDQNRQNREAAPTKVTAHAEPAGLDGPQVPAAFELQEPDPIEEKLRKSAARDAVEAPPAQLRCIETLGAWAGASMVASLRLKGAVEVEREAYLQHGLAGARKEPEVKAKPRSSSPGRFRTGSEEGSGWALDKWL